MIFFEVDYGWDVIEWDDDFPEDSTHVGIVYKCEDGYYRFEPSSDRLPLCYRQLMDIASYLSELNVGRM